MREDVRERDAPAKLQCTFSKVQQKSVAEEEEARDARRASRSGCMLRSSLSTRSQQLGETPATRAVQAAPAAIARAPGLYGIVEERRTLPRRARPPATARSRSGRACPARARSRRRRPGATTTPAPVSRIRSAAAPSGGTSGEDRPLGGEVLEHLAGEDPAPAPARLGDQEQQRLGVALELERPAVRARRG